MKTSNKILIGLLTTIFLIITAMFIDVRVFGVHRSEKYSVKKTENINLENYRYVKAVNIPSLEIRPSDHNHLKFIAYNDTAVFAIDHRIDNDTLFLVGKKNYYSHYSLYTQSAIEFISSKDSKIELKGLKQNNIRMKIHGGEVYCWGNDSLQRSKFNKCIISQTDSRMNLHNVTIDTLEIDMINSKAGFEKDILVLNADLKEQSNLQLRNVSEAKFKRDNSSKVYFH